MKHLTMLEKEVLQILKQLEYTCESFALYNSKFVDKEGFFPLVLSDLDFSVLKNGENIHNVKKYLENNGINLVITIDLDCNPEAFIDESHPTFEFIEFGKIKGENLEEIQRLIQALICKLDQGRNQIIWLDEKGINSNFGVIFEFKILKGGKSLPRTKMLKFLSKQTENTPTGNLFKKSGFSRSGALKRCIDDINTAFISNFGEELICHDKTNGTFRINRERFNFVVKIKQ